MVGMSPQALLVITLFAVGWLVGEEALSGIKWLGREAKKGGAAVVHTLKKIPHPHHQYEPPDVKK